MSLLPIWGVRSGMPQQLAAMGLSAVYIGSIVLQVAIGWLSDRVSRLAALRLCGAVGLAGALALLGAAGLPPVVFVLLFLWGGIAPASTLLRLAWRATGSATAIWSASMRPS